MANFNRKIVNLVASKSVYADSSELLRKVCIVSLGDTNITKGQTKTINISTMASINPQNTTKSILDSYFVYAAEEYITVLELGAVSAGTDTITKKVESLKKLLDDETIKNYIYLVDKQFIAEATFQTLVSAYNDINKMVYFVMGIEYGTDIASDLQIPKYANFKSALFIYEMLDGANAMGTFAGVYMNRFKISANNTMKPFAYQYINSNLKDITKTLADTMDQKNIIYFSSIIGKPSFYEVKCQDGEAFSYYFAYDNISIRLVDAITSAIVNSANKFNSAIEYNNNGILTLKSVIESELLNCKGLKLITEFGQGYDTAEKAITGINSIAYIPFAQYIKANQADYDKNEYNGFSVEMRIMKFILRLNITSNLY